MGTPATLPRPEFERVADAITALNGDYRVDGRAAVKIAIAPNGPVP